MVRKYDLSFNALQYGPQYTPPHIEMAWNFIFDRIAFAQNSPHTHPTERAFNGNLIL
jgi:hypothetical protein